MALSQITIKGKKYPKPSIDSMNREQVRKLKPALAKMQGEDMDALWDVVGQLVPKLPKATLDALTIGECKDILTKAGVAKFDQPADGEITVGESSASTGS